MNFHHPNQQNQRRKENINEKLTWHTTPLYIPADDVSYVNPQHAVSSLNRKIIFPGVSQSLPQLTPPQQLPQLAAPLQLDRYKFIQHQPLKHFLALLEYMNLIVKRWL